MQPVSTGIIIILTSNIVSRRRERLQDLDTLSGTLQGLQGSLENEAISRTHTSSCREYQKRGLLLQGTLIVPFQSSILTMCPTQIPQVSGLNVFKQLLDDQRSLPAHQSSEDAVALVNYILRKFFKAMEQDPFIAVEAFLPKASQSSGARGMSGFASESEDDGNASDIGVRRAKKKVTSTLPRLFMQSG